MLTTYGKRVLLFVCIIIIELAFIVIIGSELF